MRQKRAYRYRCYRCYRCYRRYRRYRRYRCYRTPTQATVLARPCGCARFVFN
jgi:Helix-turn-helix domain